MVWEEMSFMSIEFNETDLKLSVSAEYRLCGRIPARVVDRTREEWGSTKDRSVDVGYNYKKQTMPWDNVCDTSH